MVPVRRAPSTVVTTSACAACRTQSHTQPECGSTRARRYCDLSIRLSCLVLSLVPSYAAQGRRATCERVNAESGESAAVGVDYAVTMSRLSGDVSGDGGKPNRRTDGAGTASSCRMRTDAFWSTPGGCRNSSPTIDTPPRSTTSTPVSRSGSGCARSCCAAWITATSIDGVVDRVHELELLGEVRLRRRCDGRPPMHDDLNDPADRAALALWSQRDASRSSTDASGCVAAGSPKHARGSSTRCMRPDLQRRSKSSSCRTWATSSVLLVRGADGERYFKALPTSGGPRPPLRDFCRSTSPTCIPRIVASRTGPSVAADGCVSRPETRRHCRRRDMGARCGPIRPFAGRLHRSRRCAEGARLSVAESRTSWRDRSKRSPPIAALRRVRMD